MWLVLFLVLLVMIVRRREKREHFNFVYEFKKRIFEEANKELGKRASTGQMNKAVAQKHQKDVTQAYIQNEQAFQNLLKQRQEQRMHWGNIEYKAQQDAKKAYEFGDMDELKKQQQLQELASGKYDQNTGNMWF